MNTLLNISLVVVVLCGLVWLANTAVEYSIKVQLERHEKLCPNGKVQNVYNSDDLCFVQTSTGTIIYPIK